MDVWDGFQSILLALAEAHAAVRFCKCVKLQLLTCFVADFLKMISQNKQFLLGPP